MRYRIVRTNHEIRNVQLLGTVETDSDGNIFRIGTVKDITDSWKREEILRARLRILEFAEVHSISEVLRMALDEIGELVDSPIGFFHFVEPDQETLSLQAWSTRTLREYCAAEGKGTHYRVDQAGVWAECIRTRRPVVHNDYASLPDKRGLPEGHAALIRELVVPVFRQHRIVAVLGVGNKAVEYTGKDIEAVMFMADIAWTIVERTRSNEAVQGLATALSQAAEVVVITDPQGTVEYVNDAFERVTGYTKAEAVGGKPSILKSGIHSDDFYAELWQTITRGQVWKGEFTNMRKDGSLFREECTISPVLNDRGEINNFIAVKQDITERVKAEAALRASLAEKEVMLKEIHHRVKNNMQVISSLLNLQSAKIADGNDRELFLQSQDRIKAMSMVHEMLYQSPDLSKIDASVYLRTLGTALLHNYAIEGGPVALAFELQPVMLDTDTAIPCGLIANELLTNALKHAFPGGRSGTITMRILAVEPSTARLVIADDGIGCDEATARAPGATRSLGLRLVSTLCRQLGGTLSIDTTAGTTFTMEFPVGADPRLSA